MGNPSNRKFLFLDDHWIESVADLKRTMHQPTKRGAVMRPDVASDGGALQVRCAPVWVPDEQVYKLHYLYSAAGENAGTAYAQSRDGVSWEKPAVGKLADGRVMQDNHVEVDPSLRWPDNYIHGVVYDPDDPRPERRYKGFLGCHGRQWIVSPDGINWERLPLPPIESQDESQLTYDRDDRTFLAMVKRRGPYGRSVYLVTSHDFEHWTDWGLIFHADDRDQEHAKEVIGARVADRSLEPMLSVDPKVWSCDIYNMAVFPYEGLYVGLPAFFYHAGPDFSGRNHDGFHHIQLAVSRDRRTWTRMGERGAFIGPSPSGVGVYDRTQLLPTTQPIEHGDELWFYYTGLKWRVHPLRNNRDGTPRRREDLTPAEQVEWAEGHGAMCLAVLRRDGFISLDAGDEPGTLTTTSVALRGRELFVNVAAPNGEVWVEALDAHGAPVPGFSREECQPVIGDGVKLPVRWQGEAGVAALNARTVRLRFHLRHAKLYAFWSE